MSDDSTTPPRSEEEMAASAAKLRAEAAKALAEADTARATAAIAQIKAAKEQDEEIMRRAGDEFHYLYRFDGPVGQDSVKKCVKTLTAWHRLEPECDMEVVFFSPGGAIIPGFELFDFLVDLQAKGHKVTTGCTGMAASMAGILVQAGQYRWMSHQSWYMIHRAAFGAQGKTFDIEDEVAWVKRIEERIVDIFVARSNLTKNKIKRNWDRKDWWISSDEALDFGLVDEIRSVPSQ